MSKYIDAEKLKAEIEGRREKCADIAADAENEEVSEYYRGKEVAHDEISSLITSLQQEQPVVDFEKVWDWIDETFRETEVDSRYGESRNVLMSDYDMLKSDLREKYERDFGLEEKVRK